MLGRDAYMGEKFQSYQLSQQASTTDHSPSLRGRWFALTDEQGWIDIAQENRNVPPGDERSFKLHCYSPGPLYFAHRFC